MAVETIKTMRTIEHLAALIVSMYETSYSELFITKLIIIIPAFVP